MAVSDFGAPNLAPYYGNITDQLKTRAGLEAQRQGPADAAAQVVQRLDQELTKTRDFERKMAGEGRTQINDEMAEELAQEFQLPLGSFKRAVGRFYSEKEMSDLVNNVLKPEGLKGLSKGTNIGSPIDTNRPKIDNGDGTFSTERTITIGADNKFYNIPTIINGKQVTPDEAIAAFKAGKNAPVGAFDDEQSALASAQARTQEIGRVRGGGSKGLSEMQLNALRATGEHGEAALANYAFPKPASSGSGRKTVTIEDPGTGKMHEIPIELVNTDFNPETFDYSKFPLRGYAPKVQTNPRTGEAIQVTAAGHTKQITGPAGVPEKGAVKTFDQLNAKDQGRVDKAADEVLKDTVVKNIKEQRSQVGNIRNLLNSGIKQGFGPLQSLMARAIAGEKGVLTEQDVARNTGSRALADRFAQYISIASTGKFSKENQEGFNKLLDQIEQRSQLVLDDTVDGYVERLVPVMDEYRDAKGNKAEIDRDFLKKRLTIAAPTGDLNAGGGAKTSDEYLKKLQGKK